MRGECPNLGMIAQSKRSAAPAGSPAAGHAARMPATFPSGVPSLTSPTPAPNAPAKPRYFYGWNIVGIAMLSSAFGTGVSSFGIGVFLGPMASELGWSHAAILGAVTVRTLLGGFLGPITGPWRDKRGGPRKLLIAGTLTLGLSMIALKWVDDLWLFYVLFGIGGALGQQGSGPVITEAVVPKWFMRGRARAIGIASTGTGMGPLLFPFLITWIVLSVGWRDAWLVLGIVVIVVLLPLSFFLHTSPEDIGLLPDGDDAPKPGAPRRAPASERSLTPAEAVRSVSFYMLLLTFSFSGMAVNGYHPNQVPFFRDQGLSATAASAIVSLYGFFSISSRLLWTILASRYSIRNLLVVQGFITASLIAFLALGAVNVQLVVLCMALQGLSNGGHFLMQPLIAANYFGRAHIGAIRGYMRPVLTVTAAIAPLIVGFLYDRQQSYTGAFLAIAALWIVAALTVLLAKPPRAKAGAGGAAPAAAG
ncbi:MAG: MFS transporter [SAR202 cluster bacterium]|nr:MFS transporter [SAR202 cluster bacterium]